MVSKILKMEDKEFYPITHVSCVLMNSGVTLEDYLSKIVSSVPHTHNNKIILDKIEVEYTIEKDNHLSKVIDDNLYKKHSEILNYGTWYGTKAPYTYTISIPNIVDSSIVNLLVGSDMTVEEYNQFKSANIVIASDSVSYGVITLKAYGEKPTIDLPIVLSIRGLERS